MVLYRLEYHSCNSEINIRNHIVQRCTWVFMVLKMHVLVAMVALCDKNTIFISSTYMSSCITVWTFSHLSLYFFCDWNNFNHMIGILKFLLILLLHTNSSWHSSIQQVKLSRCWVNWDIAWLLAALHSMYK